MNEQMIKRQKRVNIFWGTLLMVASIGFGVLGIMIDQVNDIYLSIGYFGAVLILALPIATIIYILRNKKYNLFLMYTVIAFTFTMIIFNISLKSFLDANSGNRAVAISQMTIEYPSIWEVTKESKDELLSVQSKDGHIRFTLAVVKAEEDFQSFVNNVYEESFNIDWNHEITPLFDEEVDGHRGKKFNYQILGENGDTTVSIIIIPYQENIYILSTGLLDSGDIAEEVKVIDEIRDSILFAKE